MHLLPVWAFRYFVSTDGAAHLYNAWVLKAMLLDPQSRFRVLLDFNLNPEPNYLSHALLAGLLTVLPPWLAEKVVLTLYVAGLPLAVRYLLQSWQPAAGFLAVLAFPLIYSVVLQWGFYNFCLSMVVLLLALGYWKRHLAGVARPGARHIAGLVGLVTLLYLAHPLAYLTAGLLLGLLLLEQLLTAPPRGGRRGLAPIIAQAGALLLAFLPTLPLLGWYFWRKGGEGNGAPAPLGLARYATDLLELEPLRYMGPAERPYRVLVALVLLLALGYAARRHWRGRALAPAWGWAAGGGLLALGYLLVPDALAGGSVIRPRLGLLCYLVALGGLATVAYRPAVRWVLLLGGFGAAGVLLGFRFGRYQMLQAGLDEYRSAAAYIQPGSTLAPLQFAQTPDMPASHDPAVSIDAFGHTAGYLAVERNLVDYENYEAQTGYFPLIWRAGQERLSQRDSLPQRLDVTPRPGSPAPDYVLLWALADTTAVPSANRRRALAQLDSFYCPVYRSRTGLARLYVHRRLAVARVTR
ncbi:hypothetical protein Q3A66_14255 [Hymenobacter sp. BT770]|uniref:hypothetical protein n=1 Tax=Hymenobacter sp. BT770 TaxID=2886942 RepID=UPI001D1299B5|nr:hypothetical protein [Hymenobacter sp. BT770]MCC3154085.1 hypothetical protein [Hymenobacter sp. BT770]MDO3416229.1 hypothetical protein [Hymenobacter sp. BT770]